MHTSRLASQRIICRHIASYKAINNLMMVIVNNFFIVCIHGRMQKSDDIVCLCLQALDHDFPSVIYFV